MNKDQQLFDAFPAFDDLPQQVKSRAAVLAGLSSISALRAAPVNPTSAPRLARALAVAALEDPERALEEAPIRVLIPSATRDGARVTLASVYGFPESNGLAPESLLSWLIELSLRSAAADAITPAGDTLHLSSENDVLMTNGAVAASVSNALQEIAAWTYLEFGGTSLFEALRLGGIEPQPAKVRHAFDVLERIACSDAALPARGRDYDLLAALDDLEAVVGIRAWEIYAARHLRGRPRPTLEEIGADLGLTRERVRQLESHASKIIADTTADPSMSVLKRAAVRLYGRLGEVASLRDLADALKLIDPRQDALPGRPERVQLILDLAGPYERVGDWLVRGDVARRAEAALADALAGGPVSFAQAVATTTSLGIREAVAREWLGTLNGFRELGDAFVLWRGSVIDKAEAVLRVEGAPMSMQRIFDAIGEDRSFRTLVNGIQADQRFIRRSLDQYGLAEWGGDEYTTIVEEIREELNRQGGEVTLAHLLEVLPARFGVSSSSVRTYATQHPLFTMTSRGTVCLRAEETPPSSRHRPLHESRACFRLDHGWALRLRVTRDTLRGSGTSIPAALAEHAGVLPGSTRSFESEFGPIPMSWQGIQPNIGSHRRAADALELQVGDLLFIEFDESSNVLRFRGTHARDIETKSGIARLACELGSDVNEPDPVGWVCRALAIDRDERDALAMACRRLRGRGESDLADLIDDEQLSRPDVDVFEFLAKLGE